MTDHRNIVSIAVNTRVRLLRDIDRYPHFIASKDATGVVSFDDGEVFCVRLDEYLPGAEEWDNEIVWSIRDGDEPMRDVRLAMQECRDCGDDFPYDPDADRCPTCAAAMIVDPA